MRYLIYIPGQHDGTVKELFAQLGLSEIENGIDVIASEGPDGQRGKLCGWLSSTQNQLLYKPEAQTWIPSAKSGDRESGAYWVGVWNDSPPTEEDLRKPNHRRGSFVKLGDGDRWSIVVPGNLDRFPLLNSDGTLTWVVDNQFNWYVTEVDKRKEELIPGSTEGNWIMVFDLAKDWFFLVSVLQINYRLVPEVAAYLNLFSENSLRTLLAAMVGLNVTTE